MSRRAKGEGCIRKRKDGRWEGLYTVGYNVRTGKIVRKSVYGKTQAEVRDKLAKAIREYRGAPIDHTGNYTVEQWMRLWFETYSKPFIRPTTASSYENYIENHIIPGLGRLNIHRLTPIHVQRFYLEEKESGRVPRYKGMNDLSLSNRFIRGIHNVLHQAMDKAVKLRILNYNPCDDCKVPKLEHQEMKIIPPEKVGTYLKEAETAGVLPIFYLELTSGLRRGELMALEMSDLNVEDCTISVSKTVIRVNNELLVSTPKTQNSIRTVTVPPKTVELILEYHQRYPSCNLMFPSPRTGSYMNPNSIYRIHKNLLKKAGIDERVRFHDLRHTFSTIALQSGVDAKTLSGMLGHYSAAFTLDTYTHITKQMQTQAAEKMGDFMEAATYFAKASGDS